MIEYMSTVAAAHIWGITVRRIARLCSEGRIYGAQKIARVWLIPKDATKPNDERIKTGKYIKEERVSSPGFLFDYKTIEDSLNTVFEADCLDKMRDLPTESIDMILCDLPYGITQNAWDSYIPLNPLWEEYYRIIKPSGVIALTSSGAFTAKLISSKFDLFRYKWVWEKSKPTNFLNAKKQPLRKHEDICIFYKKQPTYNPQMRKGEAYDKGVRKNQLSGSYGDFAPVHVHSSGERYPTDIIYVKTAESEGPVYHPTQKPVELGQYLIRTYTNPGDIVLDNACGSGSFLVSALLEGRNFIGIEKNEDVALFKKEPIDYIEVCKSRLMDVWRTLSQEKKASVFKSSLIRSFQEESFLCHA